ncbi:MAG: deoxyribodipyrimidine photo-lyase [Syntrophorhabdaceae bacterium]|nr:deoxyribodipyrimidine photo-lyase [Syntrophorhabdaceae bacterium]
MEIDKRRVRVLGHGLPREGPVAYWMSRDQRIEDNWALLFAQSIAYERRQPLCVIFCLVHKFLNGTLRPYDFMVKGLEEVEGGLKKKNIPFFLLKGLPEKEIPYFLETQNIGVLVTDFDPLKIKREWKRGIARNIDIPFFEVDTHNIVPCWIASDKQEFGAYTIRPKIHRLLKEFLTEFPPLLKHNFSWKKNLPRIDWNFLFEDLSLDRSVSPVKWIKPGEKEARITLKGFIKERLSQYNKEKNDPNSNVQSNLSPYMHFGQISSQRIALEVINAEAEKDSKEAFLEELIVRKELSDNYCFYNDDYDNFEGLPPWAKKTLNDHRKDRRPYSYTLYEFEEGKTHDPLWNAAQLEMVTTGKMHGYMRMYWAKKILEWTRSPEEALEISIYLNDRYSLDGRDPNGYTGIAWSIGGVHDRPWAERPIFGKIRYMSYNGCKKKFDVMKYIKNR